MTEPVEKQPWRAYVDRFGDLMVSIDDVLTWLRNCEAAWANVRDDRPQRVAEWIGDTVRDIWIDAMRREADR